MEKEPHKEQHKPIEKLELGSVQREKSNTFKKVCCPSCDNEIKAADLNLQNELGKCTSCNAIFSIANEVKHIKAQQEMQQKHLRPEGIDLFYYKDELDITIQQHVQGLDMFMLICLPMIAVFSTLFLFSDKVNMPLYIPAAFTIASLYYVYKAMNYKENKIFVDINSKNLSIKFRPKNLRKDRTFDVTEIDQIYLKHAGDGVGFTLVMLVNGIEGQKHANLFNVNSLSKAKYLEQEIERYLNIENRKIPEATV